MTLTFVNISSILRYLEEANPLICFNPGLHSKLDSISQSYGYKYQADSDLQDYGYILSNHTIIPAREIPRGGIRIGDRYP